GTYKRTEVFWTTSCSPCNISTAYTSCRNPYLIKLATFVSSATTRISIASSLHYRRDALLKSYADSRNSPPCSTYTRKLVNLSRPASRGPNPKATRKASCWNDPSTNFRQSSSLLVSLTSQLAFCL